MILGNIVSNNPLDEIPNFKYETFDSFSEFDNSLPTLYVGYNETKKHLGEINPLEHQITPKTFWVETKKENARSFTIEYFKFQIHCHKEFIRNISYVYFDPFKSTPHNKKILRAIINNGSNVVFSEKMFYVLVDESIIGFDYTSLRFVGWKIKKIKEWFVKKGNPVYYQKELPSELKRFSVIVDTEMYSPYLLNFYRI